MSVILNFSELELFASVRLYINLFVLAPACIYIGVIGSINPGASSLGTYRIPFHALCRLMISWGASDLPAAQHILAKYRDVISESSRNERNIPLIESVYSTKHC